MRMKLFRSIFLTILSAVLLILAFPQADLGMLSWFGLVPLMLAIDGKSCRASFGWSYLTGLVFFWGTFYWFVHVTWIGTFFLMAYLALYFGLFGWGYWCLNRLREKDQASSWLSVCQPLMLAALWVSLEFIRGHFLSGFDWASLGHSQYKNTVLIQIADMTGVYGVTFVVVAVNAVIKMLISDWRTPRRRRAVVAAVVCLLFLTGVRYYGAVRLTELSGSTRESWRIAVVQANILQSLKSDARQWPDNFDQHARLTLEAAKDRPDLIIWPETALPGYMWEDDVFIQELRSISRGLDTPVLFGAVTARDHLYFNSALLTADGHESATYDKMHLVPFGEYIPLKRFFPSLIADMIPFEDFSAGDQPVIFEVTKGQRVLKLSTLICFEDTLARSARRFASRGTELLVNITNDGWFRDTGAPFLHMQAALFRAVENRRWLVRAANTGVSCSIDPAGRIVDVIDESGRKTFVKGWKIFTVQPRDEETFYMKYGDLFAGLCMIGTGAGILAGLRRRKA